MEIIKSSYTIRVKANQTPVQAKEDLMAQLADQGIYNEENVSHEWVNHNDRVIEVIIGDHEF